LGAAIVVGIMTSVFQAQSALLNIRSTITHRKVATGTLNFVTISRKRVFGSADRFGADRTLDRGRPAWPPESTATPRPHRPPQLCKRCVFLIRRRISSGPFLRLFTRVS